jgi:hypothetical protein
MDLDVPMAMFREKPRQIINETFRRLGMYEEIYIAGGSFNAMGNDGNPPYDGNDEVRIISFSREPIQ